MDSEQSKRRTATRLGWAGLIPFPALVIASQLLPGQPWLAWLAAYALAIICFLAGAWWGIALLRRDVRILLASNAVVVFAWACFLANAALFLPLAACLLYLEYRVEQGYPLFGPTPHYYRQLRLRLTAIACVSLLAGFAVTL